MGSGRRSKWRGVVVVPVVAAVVIRLLALLMVASF